MLSAFAILSLKLSWHMLNLSKMRDYFQD